MAAMPLAPPEPASPDRHVVVVGASAGGVEALEAFVGALPPGLPAPVFVVLHVLADGTSALPHILARSGPLSATAARDGHRFEAGHIYVAPPDRHLVLERDLVRLTSDTSEKGHRPAVDPLFRSAARHYGRGVVGVLLSGSLDDGAQGLRSIGERGGATLVQDPAEAQYEGMPRSAIAAGHVDLVAPVSELAARVRELVRPAAPPVVVTL